MSCFLNFKKKTLKINGAIIWCSKKPSSNKIVQDLVSVESDEVKNTKVQKFLVYQLLPDYEYVF